jgi:O-acetyl-ADP-ribose deacetylase (regulator of RNase III)
MPSYSRPVPAIHHLIAEGLKAHIPLQLNDVIITGAGTLQAKYLFSAVIIDWANQSGSGQLISEANVITTARKCISIAAAMGLHSIAFTPWGTRIGAIEAAEITAILIQSIISELDANPGNLKEVFLVSNQPEHYQWFIDRAFVFNIIYTQVEKIREQVGKLSLPKSERKRLLEMLDNLSDTVFVINENIAGDKITVGNISDSTAIAVGKQSAAEAQSVKGDNRTDAG